MEMIPTCALGSAACVASEVLSSSYLGSGVAVDVAPELLWPEHGADVLAAAALVAAAAAALVVAAADQLQLFLEDSAYWVVVSLKQKQSQEPAE
jgi:hypothetical protein